MFLSGTGGTLLKHSHHLPDVSLFKNILITNIHSKEHLQLTHRLQINKTIKAVSSYFKLSPHVSLRSAGMSEVLLCFLGWRVLIMQTDWQTDTLLHRTQRGQNIVLIELLHNYTAFTRAFPQNCLTVYWGAALRMALFLFDNRKRPTGVLPPSGSLIL